MRKFIIVLIMIMLALPSTCLTVSYGAVSNPYASLPSTVSHSMTVRVSVLGISGIDQNQLLWNLAPVIRPNIQSNSRDLQGLSSPGYGTNFTLKYEINSVPTAATSNLKNYLKSIAVDEPVPAYLQGSTPSRNKYTIIDALKTEDWLNSHISDFGGIPDDGYLLIAADLSDISSLNHYYSLQYNDLDKASAQATYAGDPTLFPIVNWMFSWGGHYRFYFIDLSGGDPNIDYTNTGHVPIQNFDTRSLSGQQISLQRNVQTVTEYVADYVSEAVRNLFLPDYTYSPTFATAYRIAINVFDETGRLSSSNIGDYLSTSLVKKAFAALVPYASWDVSLNTRQLRDDSGLANVVSNSLAFSVALSGSRGRTINANSYDVRPVYSYLRSHLGQYVDTTGGTVVLPIFEFIFKNGGSFAQTTEDSVGTFAGVSLGDLAITVSSDMSLFDDGYGLTRDTIHELGHSMGCMHPHSFGQGTEDFVASTMAYAPYEYSFSQFDVDAIQRGHADQFLSILQATFEIGATTLQTQTQNILQQAKTNYDTALTSYSKKDYVQTVKTLQSISQNLAQTFDTEAQATQGRASQASITSDTAKQFIQQANTLLTSAKSEKEAGRLGRAYQLLAGANTMIDLAVGPQAQAQSSQGLLTGSLGVGIAVGIAIGVLLTFLVIRVKKRI